jgi:hypothetical protein
VPDAIIVARILWFSWVRWYKSIILAFGKLRQENCEFKDNWTK